MYKSSKVARRYAKALFDLAQEKDVLEPVLADLKLIKNTLNESRDLVLLIKSPIVKGDKKRTILDKVFSGQLSDLTKLFIDLVVKQQREASLVEIPFAYEVLYRELKKITVASVTSAVPLSEAAKKKVAEIINKNGGSTLEIEEKIDKSIIGGIIINVDDFQLDASVSKQLKDLKYEFSENKYVSKL